VVARTRRLALAALLAVSVMIVSGCSTRQPSASRTTVGGTVKIGTAKLGKLGAVLVTGIGQVLYMFQPDQHTKVTCNMQCQSLWPPLVAPSTGVVKATEGAKQSLIGSDENRYDGKRIVTYNGWPLYTYTQDGSPGEDSGQNILLNGGYWWVIRADGKPERWA
jgi:predicted lipoprotein with Yx(FWY)xxD motif